MRLLRAGIPLSLLLDLADPAGPDTRRIMAVERRDAQDVVEALPRTLVAAAALVPDLGVDRA